MPYRVLVGFTKREEKNIQKYLEDEDVDLDFFDINGELIKIKEHKVIFDLMKNLMKLFSISKKWRMTICYIRKHFR